MAKHEHPEPEPTTPLRVDGHGACTGDCGDCIEMDLEVEAERIHRIAFRCTGCTHTVVAANGAADLAHHGTLHRALELTALDVIEHVGLLDDEHDHCALIAVNALHEAVVDALRARREPWKSIYRPTR